jgi:cysteine synthase
MAGAVGAVISAHTRREGKYRRVLLVWDFCSMADKPIADRYAQGVFEGSDSIRAWLNPANHAPLPLVELPDRLNPYRGDGVRVFAKLAYLTPLLNIKLLPAWNMLQEARNRGRLQDVHTLIENSSGNTAFDLAVLAGALGIGSVRAFVPFDIAPGKLELLRIAGVGPQMTKETPGQPSGIAEARRVGEQAGFFSPSQYENQGNPEAFEKWLAPEVWKQTEGKITVFAAGLGTTGTLVGCARFFRRMAANVATVGCLCAANEAVPGVRSRERLKEIKFDWQAAADTVVEVGTKESFRLSLKLCQSGLMAGPSSGFVLAGLYRALGAAKAESRLETLRNGDGEVLAVFVCADTPLPYLDKYSTHLDAWEF